MTTFSNGSFINKVWCCNDSSVVILSANKTTIVYISISFSLITGQLQLLFGLRVERVKMPFFSSKLINQGMENSCPNKLCIYPHLVIKSILQQPTQFIYTLKCCLANRSSFFILLTNYLKIVNVPWNTWQGPYFISPFYWFYWLLSLQFVTTFEGNRHLINSKHGFWNNWCWVNMADMVNDRFQFQKIDVANLSEIFLKSLLTEIHHSQ